jgi:hypothetical protein
MYKTLGLITTTTAALALTTVAQAHSLRLECKKTTNQDVVCRTITTDGEPARDVEIQLLATGDYRVLATGKHVCFQDTRCRVPSRRHRRQGACHQSIKRRYLVAAIAVIMPSMLEA